MVIEWLPTPKVSPFAFPLITINPYKSVGYEDLSVSTGLLPILKGQTI